VQQCDNRQLSIVEMPQFDAKVNASPQKEDSVTVIQQLLFENFVKAIFF
jgi:hypothetical protein